MKTEILKYNTEYQKQLIDMKLTIEVDPIGETTQFIFKRGRELLDHHVSDTLECSFDVWLLADQFRVIVTKSNSTLLLSIHAYLPTRFTNDKDDSYSFNETALIKYYINMSSRKLNIEPSEYIKQKL